MGYIIKTWVEECIRKKKDFGLLTQINSKGSFTYIVILEFNITHIFTIYKIY